MQVGYGQENWGVAAIYSRIQNGNDIVVVTTNFTLDSYEARAALMLSG